MRYLIHSGVIALALWSGATIVRAQDNNPPPQNPAAGVPAPKADQQTLPANPANPAISAMQPENAGPALVNGKLNAPGAPQDTQTVPAKYSQRNDALDKLPIMAHPLPLTEEQRQAIYRRLTQAQAPVAEVDAKPAQSLPLSVKLNDLPADIAQNYPSLRGYKFARLPDKLLVVNPTQRVVVGEIIGA
jgi:hypothetical protein